MSEIFRRYEKKYIINKEQYNKIQNIIREYMIQDKYGESTICNIYFDSGNYELISHSIEKPFYKDKVRLRSYNTPTQDSKVFLEIKRKCDGVVGKRRIEMSLKQFDQYFQNGNVDSINNTQIKLELDYYFKKYALKPAMFISYKRKAYYQKDNPDFRLTFDNHILARQNDLKLDAGTDGNAILDDDMYIMEIKTLSSIPLWFVNELSRLNIVPGSFSKYGTAYEKFVIKPTLKLYSVDKTKESVSALKVRIPKVALAN